MSPPAADTDQLLSRFLGILPSTPEEKILRMLIELGCEVVGGQEGSLLIYDKEADVLRFAMTVGDPESEKKLRGQAVPLGAGLTGLAAATLEVQTGAPTFKDVEQKQREGDGSTPDAVIAAPMVSGDELVGVITAVSFQDGKRFSSKDARLYAGFAAIAAIVVDLRRRLSAYESGEAAAPEEESERAKLERRVLASVQRLIGGDTARLAAVADLLGAVENVAVPALRPAQ
ncbi:MAG: GAF domain-containing protein [Rhodospirillaceae bacterium]|nr:GAF domain-containing protein [Rhodospirillaceae bacterium]